MVGYASDANCFFNEGFMSRTCPRRSWIPCAPSSTPAAWECGQVYIQRQIIGVMMEAVLQIMVAQCRHMWSWCNTKCHCGHRIIVSSSSSVEAAWVIHVHPGIVWQWRTVPATLC